ncbi:MAG: hypothetical protein VKO39_05405 [Cyanobacteriota bacterium]|nr:hypothetical protein [Cyanobacteriota bacterium]
MDELAAERLLRGDRRKRAPAHDFWILLSGLGSFEPGPLGSVHGRDPLLFQEHAALESILEDLGLPPLLPFLQGIATPPWLSPLARTVLSTYMHTLLLTRVVLAEAPVPSLLIGYSLGELVAATISGVCTERDVLRWLLRISQVIETTTEPVVCYFVNGPFPTSFPPSIETKPIFSFLGGSEAHLAACPTGCFQEVMAWFTQQDLICASIGVNHGFHTPFLEPAFEPLTADLHALPTRPGRVPWYSCATGASVNRLDPQHLWAIMRQPIALGPLGAWESRCSQVRVLEYGPIRFLTSFRDLLPRNKELMLSSLFQCYGEPDNQTISVTLANALRSITKAQNFKER